MEAHEIGGILCKSCKDNLILHSFFKNEFIGPPNIKCKNCGFVNNTQCQWYSTLTKSERNRIITPICMPYILGAIIGVVLILTPFFINETKSQKDSAQFVIMCGILLFGYVIYRLVEVKNIYKYEEEWKNKYNSNGCFLTEDEYKDFYKK